MGVLGLNESLWVFARVLTHDFIVSSVFHLFFIPIPVIFAHCTVIFINMASAMVGGAFLSASLEVLFDQLASKSMGFILGRRTEEGLLVKKLMATILATEAIFNDAGMRLTPNPAAKEWLTELEDTVNEAQNLLNAIATEGSKNKLRSRLRSESMQEMLERLEYMSEQKDVIDWKAPSDILPTTSIPVDESSISGRDGDKEATVSILLSDYQIGEDPTQAFVIVGVPGIGKTTHAKLLYNDNRVEQHFHVKVWVCVQAGLNTHMLTKKIFEVVTQLPCTIDDLNLLQVRLKEELIGKRLLLVLDDVQYIEDRMEWETLWGSFRSCEWGSHVVVTTRSEDVAGTIRTLPVYHLNQLPYDDCWVLFSRHAFDDRSAVIDPRLEVIGGKIVKKCRGIPLAVKSLGILFRLKPNCEEWERILEDEIWYSSRDMTTILHKIKHGLAKGRDPIAINTHPVAPGCNWKTKNIQSKRSRLPVYLVLWLILLGILSASVFITANKVQTIKRKEELSRMCNWRAKMLQDQFEIHVNNTNDIAIFLTQFHRLDRLLDKEQSEKFLRNYVLAALRMQPFLEAVVIEASIIGNKHSYIMASHSRKLDESALVSLIPGQQDILKAMATGKTTISRPSKHLNSRRVLFAMAHPIYQASLSPNSTVDQRCRAVAGYLGTFFRFDTFVEHVLGQIDGGQTISVSVFDATESPSCLLLYKSGDHDSSQPLLHESKLKLGDPCQRYTITCRYRQKAPLSWISIALTGSTLVIGLLVGCLLLGAAIHSLTIQELEAQVEASNAANSQFLSAASQEIRTPAYSILEALGLVLGMELSWPQRQYIRVAREGCERLIALISKLLDQENSALPRQTIENQSPPEQEMNTVP